MGVSLTKFRCGQIGLIFRETPTQDHGVDGEIELLVDRKATGRLIGTQVKCGASYLSESNERGFVFRFDSKHFDYWTNHSLPVIVVLVDHEAEVCYWGEICSTTAERTGLDYKTLIPRTQTIAEESLQKLMEIAAPAIANSSYQIVSEEDQSTGFARRISKFVRLNAGPDSWTRSRIRQLILEMTSEARSSEYYRKEYSEAAHKDRKADVVWVYVYRSESDRNLGAYIARSIWVDPQLPAEHRPMSFQGELDPSGMVINWNEQFEEIVRIVDEQRSSKAEYVHFAKTVLADLVPFFATYHYQAPAEGTNLDFSEFVSVHEMMVAGWSKDVFPPHECERLGNCLTELIDLLDNAKIFAERLQAEKLSRTLAQFQRYINHAYAKSRDAEYELKLIT